MSRTDPRAIDRQAFGFKHLETFYLSSDLTYNFKLGRQELPDSLSSLDPERPSTIWVDCDSISSYASGILRRSSISAFHGLIIMLHCATRSFGKADDADINGHDS